MTMRALLLAAIASVGLVGCVGELDDGNMTGGGGSGVGSGTNPNPQGSNSMAKMMFEQNVYPIIHNPGQVSDCSSCHGPGGAGLGAFVSANLSDAYATATSFQGVVGNFTPTTAGILTKIDGGHNGRMYTADQRTAIVNWLAQEVVERGGTGGGSGSGSGGGESAGQATARLLNQWSACLSLTNFQSAKMAQQFGAQMQTNGGARCESCHATGGNGNFIVTEVENTYYSVVDTDVTYMAQYFTVDLSQGVPSAKVIVNDLTFYGVSKAAPPHTEHPTFQWDNSIAKAAVDQLYTLTTADLANCQASGTKLSPPAM
jgi:hypothetical protein